MHSVASLVWLVLLGLFVCFFLGFHISFSGNMASDVLIFLFKEVINCFNMRFSRYVGQSPFSALPYYSDGLPFLIGEWRWRDSNS